MPAPVYSKLEKRRVAENVPLGWNREVLRFKWCFVYNFNRHLITLRPKFKKGCKNYNNSGNRRRYYD